MPEPYRSRDWMFPFAQTEALARVLRPNRLVLPAIAGLSLVQAALEGLAIGLIVPLFNLLLSGGSSTGEGGVFAGVAGMLHPDRRVVLLVGAIVALVIAKNIAAMAAHLLTGWFDARIGHGLRSELARMILHVGYPFFLERRPEELVNLVSGESWRATDAVRSYVLAVGSAAAVAGYLMVLILLDWRLALFVFVAGLLIRRVEALLSARTSRLSGEVTAANDALAGRILSVITGMRIIRVFGAERLEQARFDAASRRVAGAVRQVWVSGGIVSPLIEILFMLVFALILVGATEADLGLDLPRLAAFLIVLQRAQPHLRGLEQARVGFTSASGGLRRLEALLEPAGKPARPAGGRPFAKLDTAIDFEGVSYRYPGAGEARPALDDVSIRIEAGRATAVVGPSGSGKSTVVNLLCRLVAPSRGRILVDGTPLEEISPESWRAHLALAGQDTGLVDGTVFENVAYGHDNAVGEAVWAALRAADADGFVRQLPQGLDARIGSQGMALSGGQRQRIALARAFLRDPSILILDEATNALDGLSEDAILSLIRDWGRHRTIIVISHRESTLALCDRRIRLEGGRLG